MVGGMDETSLETRSEILLIKKVYVLGVTPESYMGSNADVEV